MAATHKN